MALEQYIFYGVVLLIISTLIGIVFTLLTGKISDQKREIEKLHAEVAMAMAKQKEDTEKAFMSRRECSLVHDKSAIQMGHIVESVKKLEQGQDSLSLDVKKIHEKINQLFMLLQKAVPNQVTTKMED